MTETSTDMLRVEVSRPMWYRGNGSISSRLLRSQDGKMCCIGFATLDAGVDPKALLDRSAINNLLVDEKTSVVTLWDKGVLEMLYMENDDRGDEDTIIELGKKTNIEFVFVN